ncbi:uncharacterized protein LOC144439456 [Glandiceps talaboti]
MGTASSSSRSVDLTKLNKETSPESTKNKMQLTKKEGDPDSPISEAANNSVPDTTDAECDYSLIENDLEAITKIIDFLKAQTDYAIPEVIDEKFRRLSFFYDPVKEEEKTAQVANFLADHYPEIYVNVQHQLHSDYDIFNAKTRDELLGLLAAYLSTSVLWNTCDAAPKMCREVGKAGIIGLIIEDLKELKDYAVAVVRHQYKDLYLRSLLATLHNIIRNCLDNRGYFRDAGAVPLLQHYLGMENILYRTYALLTLSYIVNEDENDKINTGTENLEFFVRLLKSAVEAENHRSTEHSSFHVTELMAGMIKLAVNDSNKVRFVDQGVLPHLVKLLQPNCTIKEQRLAATLLWTLAFYEDNKNKIRNEKRCIEGLERLQRSPDAGLSAACSGALWELKQKEEPDAKRTDVKGRGHVMISYNWDVQNRVIRLKDKLSAAGYNVWMDIEKMGGSTLEAMADAVQNADVVLICMAEKYKYSNPCRSEAEYTYKLHKDYIPIKVQPKYSPDGWLGILVGTKLYFDFSSEENLETNFPSLVRELGDRGRKSGPIVRSQEVDTHTAPSGAIPPSGTPSTRGSTESWDCGDVTVWLRNNELDHLVSKFKRYNGPKLLTLRKISVRAPEFFYGTLKKDFGLKDMYDIVIFTDALEKLI